MSLVQIGFHPRGSMDDAKIPNLRGIPTPIMNRLSTPKPPLLRTTSLTPNKSSGKHHD